MKNLQPTSFLRRFLFSITVAVLSLVPVGLQSQVSINLPADVPPFNFTGSAGAAPGWLLVSATSIGPANYPSTLMMINPAGELVFYLNLNSETQPPYQNRRLSDFRLQTDSLLTFASLLPSTGGIEYYALDSSLNFVDTLHCIFLPTDAHDMLRTSDGHLHFFCEFDSVMDLSGMLTENGDPGSSTATVRVQLVVEADASSNWLWFWNPLFHTAPTEIDNAFFTDSGLLDLTHYNSLDVDSAGNYLLSSRHLNQVSYVNKATGQYIWRLGGQMNDFTLVGDNVWFTGQHDARFHPGGRLSLYDNATSTPQGLGRGIEYLIDTVNMTATVDWLQVNEWNMRSQFVGNHQVLPNGNRLIGWGGMLPLTQSLTAQEFDAAHQEVMSFDLPAGWISYRVTKAELPWSIDRPVIICDSFQLVAPPGHASYYWNTGENTQAITPTSTGMYQVWVPMGSGKVSSEIFQVTNSGSPCGLVGLTEPAMVGLSLFPNPAGETVALRWPCAVQARQISICDVQGREWRRWQTRAGDCEMKLDLGGLPDGLMLLRLETDAGFVYSRLLRQ